MVKVIVSSVRFFFRMCDSGRYAEARDSIGADLTVKYHVQVLWVRCSKPKWSVQPETSVMVVSQYMRHTLLHNLAW